LGLVAQNRQVPNPPPLEQTKVRGLVFLSERASLERRALMVCRFVGASMLAVAVFGAATTAWATHGTAPNVDFIDGSGPGVFAGTLTNQNPVDSADWYTFAADAGTPVTISMESAAFDTFLHLYRALALPAVGDARASYVLIAEDDDGGGSLNSLISVPALPQSGFYVVAAESFSAVGDALGSYELVIHGDVRPVVPEPGTMIASLVLGICCCLGNRSRK
jgi:hypothetical protein